MEKWNGCYSLILPQIDSTNVVFSFRRFFFVSAAITSGSDTYGGAQSGVYAHSGVAGQLAQL